MKNPIELPPTQTDDDILKSLDKYRPEAYFDGNRPVGGGTTDDINDLRDYYRQGRTGTHFQWWAFETPRRRPISPHILAHPIRHH